MRNFVKTMIFKRLLNKIKKIIKRKLKMMN